MQAIFCPHCGAKHTYNLAKPKFCSSCGGSLGSFEAPSKTRASQNEDDDDDDGTFSNSNSVPRLRKIEVDIAEDNSYRTLDLGSIVDGKGEKMVEPLKKERKSIDEFGNA